MKKVAALFMTAFIIMFAVIFYMCEVVTPQGPGNYHPRLHYMGSDIDHVQGPGFNIGTSTLYLGCGPSMGATCTISFWSDETYLWFQDASGTARLGGPTGGGLLQSLTEVLKTGNTATESIYLLSGADAFINGAVYASDAIGIPINSFVYFDNPTDTVGLYYDGTHTNFQDGVGNFLSLSRSGSTYADDITTGTGLLIDSTVTTGTGTTIEFQSLASGGTGLRLDGSGAGVDLDADNWRVTGAGTASFASASFSGGYISGSGITTADGSMSMNGNLIVDGSITGGSMSAGTGTFTNGITTGGGYNNSGMSNSTQGDLWMDGILTVDDTIYTTDIVATDTLTVAGTATLNGDLLDINDSWVDIDFTGGYLATPSVGVDIGLAAGVGFNDGAILIDQVTGGSGLVVKQQTSASTKGIDVRMSNAGASGYGVYIDVDGGAYGLYADVDVDSGRGIYANANGNNAIGVHAVAVGTAGSRAYGIYASAPTYAEAIHTVTGGQYPALVVEGLDTGATSTYIDNDTPGGSMAGPALHIDNNANRSSIYLNRNRTNDRAAASAFWPYYTADVMGSYGNWAVTASGTAYFAGINGATGTFATQTVSNGGTFGGGYNSTGLTVSADGDLKTDGYIRADNGMRTTNMNATGSLTVNASSFYATGTVSQWYGGDTAGDDLYISANNKEVYPSIWILDGSIYNSLQNNVGAFYIRNGSTLLSQLDYLQYTVRTAAAGGTNNTMMYLNGDINDVDAEDGLLIDMPDLTTGSALHLNVGTAAMGRDGYGIEYSSGTTLLFAVKDDGDVFASGTITTAMTMTAATATITNSLTVGGGYGSTGATLDPDGDAHFDSTVAADSFVSVNDVTAGDDLYATGEVVIGSNVAMGTSVGWYDSAYSFHTVNDQNTGRGMKVINTYNGNTAPSTINMQKVRTIDATGQAGQDNDEIAAITMNGNDDSATPVSTTYAQIQGWIDDASDGVEDGRLVIVVTEDGSFQDYLSFDGGDEDINVERALDVNAVADFSATATFATASITNVLMLTEGDEPQTPAAGDAILWLDITSHDLMIKWDDGSTSQIAEHP